MEERIKYTIAILVLLLGTGFALAGYLYFQTQKTEPEIIKPALPDEGIVSVRPDLIRVYEPSQNQVVQSPLVVSGEARGYWFFEATFPIRLLDEEGNELAMGIAQAEGEWMTEDFVSFEANLEFESPPSGNGTLVLQNDNPSDLPEHSYEIHIPVKFGPAEQIDSFEECVAAGYPILESYPRQCRTPDNKYFTEKLEISDCIITGCSEQICAEEELITTCEWRPEYECYKTAVCELQADGTCGWTMTQELIDCLEKNRMQEI